MPDKAPVILVHGMWSTPDALKDLKAAFEEQGYQVYVPCLPYHLPKNQLRGEAEQRLARAGIEDYVHAHGSKIVSLILSRFAHVFVTVISIYAILRIGLGA